MTISRYPRPGQKISPDLLAPVLDVPIPWRLLNQEETIAGSLRDLDENTWEHLSPNICAKLGAAVVREISSRIASLPDDILHQKLPTPEDWTMLAQPGLQSLQLEARTYNCLVAEGLADSPEKLESLTIADLLKIRSFGAKSLVDLLATLESLRYHAEEKLAVSSAPKANSIKLKPKISRYPRPGQPLAPKALEEILTTPLSNTVKRRYNIEDLETYSELNEQLWERLDTPSLTQLGDLVVHEIDSNLPSLPPNILYAKLPLPKNGLELQDLEMERRTYNCLKREGLLDDYARLSQLSIGEFLKFRGIGGKSLIDFLTALEYCQPRAVSELDLAADGHLESRNCAERLRELIGERYIGRDDPRLGSSLRSIDSTVSTLGEILDGISEDRYAVPKLKAMARGLSELESRIENCHRCTLSEELNAITTVGLSDRDGLIIKRYFGIHDGRPQTLKQIGDHFELTRERVRQIGVEQAQRISTARAYTPILLSAIAKLSRVLPATEKVFAEMLSQLGESSDSTLGLPTIEYVAKLLNLEFPFTVVNVDQCSIAIPKSFEAAIRPSYRLAVRMVENWGIANVPELHSELAADGLCNLDDSLIKKTLDSINGLQWLSEDREWFWIADQERSRLTLHIDLLLGLQQSLSIRQVRAAIVRSSKKREFAPPLQIFTKWLQQNPYFALSQDQISIPPSRKQREEISTGERAMVDILQEYGPLLEESRFEELCARRGIKRATFSNRLSDSPLFEFTRPNLFGLRGCVDTEQPILEELRVHPGHGAELFSLQLILSDTILNQGSCDMLHGLPGNTSAKAPLFTADGIEHGFIHIREGKISGLKTLFSRRGGSAGDSLVLSYDQHHRRWLARFGDGYWPM